MGATHTLSTDRLQVGDPRFRLVFLSGLLVLLSLVVSACIGGQSPKSQNDVIADGRRLFVANCVACHGEQGEKVAEAPLNQKQFLDSRGDALLIHVVAEGKGVMPAWGKSRGGPLTYTEIESIVAYLDAAAGRTSPSLIANSGRNVFALQCARCHGENGDRIPVAPLAAKAYVDSFSDDQLFQVISDGRGLMPAFRTGSAAPLSQDQVRAVIRYLRYRADVIVSEESRRGRELFVTNCLPCHGERGDRVPNVALASSDLLKKLGDGGLTTIIAGGKGVMPAFATDKGGTFSVAELSAMLAYLKSWAGLPAGSAILTTEMPSLGKDLYTRNCTGCHGDTGDKVAGVDLKSSAFLDGRADAALVREISQGSAHGMPAWGQSTGGPLSDGGILDIITYLRSVATTVPRLASTPQPAGQWSEQEVIARGKQLFSSDCAACHGEGRSKIAAANLADAAWLQQRGDDQLAQAIAYGKGSMPSWGKDRGGPLGANDVAAVLAYIKSVAGKGSPPATASAAVSAPPPASIAAKAFSGDAATGQKTFVRNCLACHGEDGGKIASANLADPAWLQKKGKQTLSESIANGKGAMPSWSKQKGGLLDQQDIAALVAYLWAAAGLDQVPLQASAATGPTTHSLPARD